MNKAYDRIKWPFLRVTLGKLGFQETWINRVMKLVTTVSYSYEINGFKTNSINPQTGLRQGDPLSPYLFILVFDVLSRLINDAHSKGQFQGIKLANDAPALTHLFFADDAVIFSKDSTADMYCLISILNKFISATGQKIKISKSGMIFGGAVNNSLRASISNITTIPVWTNPGVYLGVPAECGRSKSHNLQWVKEKEKVMCRMESWKENLLNPTGKETLIKAVIQAIPC